MTKIVRNPEMVSSAFPEPANTETPDLDAVIAAKVTQARAEATAEGREAGRAEAEAAFRVEVEKMQVRLAQALTDVAGLEERLVEQCREALLELACASASKIARLKIEKDDELAVRTVREALDAFSIGSVARVCVHPDDLATVRERLAAGEFSPPFQVESDPALERGGCAVRGELGTVEAGLATAEDAVRETVTGHPGAS